MHLGDVFTDCIELLHIGRSWEAFGAFNRKVRVARTVDYNRERVGALTFARISVIAVYRILVTDASIAVVGGVVVCLNVCEIVAVSTGARFAEGAEAVSGGCHHVRAATGNVVFFDGFDGFSVARSSLFLRGAIVLSILLALLGGDPVVRPALNLVGNMIVI